MPPTPSSRPPADLRPLVKIIKKKSSFLVVSHVNPDGDAAGSSSALLSRLIKSGKSADLVNVSGWTRVFREFIPKETVQTSVPKDKKYDAIFILDCADETRTGLKEDFRKRTDTVINIDHHITNSYFGDVNIIDNDAKATSEIIFDWFKAEGWLTRETAAPLLYGFLTDSAVFQAAGLDSNFFRKVSELLETGLSYSRALASVLYQGTFELVGLLAEALGGMKHSPSGGIAWACYCKEVLEKYSYKAVEVLHTGIFTQLLSVQSVKAAFVLIYSSDKSTHLELRSKDDYNVAEIASTLGGGGHVLAAGSQLEMDIPSAEKKVVNAFKAKYPELW